MTVLSSSWAYDGPVQADGSRQVIETHVCIGKPDVQFMYFAPPALVPATVLAGRVVSINSTLADTEALENIGLDAAPAVAEQAITAFLLTMRAIYRASDKADTCRIAWWLSRRIAAGHITDLQCQTAFGRTAAQWTTFKTNSLTPQSNAWAAIIAATGS